MRNIIEYIKSLTSARFTKPVSQGLIVKSECSLGVAFANDYTLLLRNFGGMMYNHSEILGLNVEHDNDCVSYTLEAREEDDTIPTDMYVICDAGIDGILFLQSQNGNIFQHVPFGECTKKADSLEDFIKSF
ncbi:MAG: SMI1/KNR4 family protein [Allobaculum sp.]|nr:SMI1/KNR4 family protein [Allobaculum sp.]